MLTQCVKNITYDTGKKASKELRYIQPLRIMQPANLLCSAPNLNSPYKRILKPIYLPLRLSERLHVGTQLAVPFITMKYVVIYLTTRLDNLIGEVEHANRQESTQYSGQLTACRATRLLYIVIV